MTAAPDWWDAGDCSVTRADVTRSLGGADWLGRSLGAEQAQTGETFRGSVDRGWRVDLFPSRVGTRARLPLRDAEIR
jgi:hypothetical protein